MTQTDQLQQELARLAEAYLSNLPQKLDELARALREVEGCRGEQLVLPQRMAHSLAGSGATFGLPNISVLAQKIEHHLMDLRERGAVLDAAVLATLLQTIEEMRAEAKPAKLPTPTTTPTRPGDEHGPVICVVEDDTAFAEALRLQLVSFGYRVAHFEHPRALIAAGLPAGTQAIVMDVGFPGDVYAGPETLLQPYAYALRQVPIVFMSSRDGVLARLEAVRAGGRGYFVKPIDFTALVEQLDRLTGRTQTPPYRVLIVEDSPSLAAYYAQILGNAGLITRVVTDPLKVPELLNEFLPDLLLTDIHMPVCSGLELAQLIRYQPSQVALPIVFLSSERDPKLMQEAMATGADDFLVKPIDPDQLVASVRARADRHRILRAQLVKDGLTGLINHTRFKEAVEVEVSRARRTGQPLAVAMLDIDHFKDVNDRYGHQIGDQVLRALSRLLLQRLRRSDVAARYGGEEFALILPETSAEGAMAAVNGIREAFRQLRHLVGQDSFRVSLSAGVATLGEQESAASLVQRADAALYEAKHQGRDRVVLAQTI
jgi:diguanylate cyclase (GGDEF)-like protein